MAEETPVPEAPPPEPTAAELFAAAVASLPGVTGTRWQHGELTVEAQRDSVVALCTALRDDPRFSFEQLMDLCGVDWHERAERFDIVYNLLSVSLNQRIRVVVRTDEATPVPSVHGVWPAATITCPRAGSPGVAASRRARRVAPWSCSRRSGAR